jgi:Ca2+-binding RTX toxin-like protein
MASLTATTTQTSAQTNHAPVIAVHDAVVAANQSVAASSLITSATDPDAGDSITDYFFWDGSDGGGHFTVNGAVQAAGQWIGVTAADLNTVRYVGGSTAGSESLFIDVNDGEIAASSVAAMASLTATTTQAQTNHAPVITVHDAVVAANQSVAASSLITSATDPDAGDSITDYFFWDGSDGGGYLTVNGAVQAAGQWIGVTAADLNTVHYVGGSAAGSETLYVDVNDGEIAASSGGAFASLIATTTRTEGKTIMWENVGDNFYNGSDGIDTIDYSRTTLGIRVDLSLSQAQSSGSEIGTDQLAAIENITGGTGNDFLVGNAAQNYFLGGGGNDSLDGGDGNDLLDGGPGNDLLKGGNGNDRMFGGINLDHLLGGAGNDSLSGGSGNDILNGGLGMDKLSGDLGRDIFVFDTALSASNVDTILKFSHTTDTIHLDDDIFKILNTGSVHSLSTGQFQKNASGLATQTDDRIVYNTSNGNLYYDPDGSGHVAAVRFATLSGHPTGIDHTDFLVVV